MLKPGFVILCAATFLLSGCAGFGHHLENTLWVNGTPNAPKITSFSLAAATGEPAQKIPLHRKTIVCSARFCYSSTGDISLPPPRVSSSPLSLLKKVLLQGEKSHPYSQAKSSYSYKSLPPVVIPNGNGTFSLIFPNGDIKTSFAR